MHGVRECDHSTTPRAAVSCAKQVSRQLSFDMRDSSIEQVPRSCDMHARTRAILYIVKSKGEETLQVTQDPAAMAWMRSTGNSAVPMLPLNRAEATHWAAESQTPPPA